MTKTGMKTQIPPLLFAVNVDDEGVGRRDVALGGETGRGGSSLSLLEEPLLPPFDTGQKLVYFDPSRKMANCPRFGRQLSPLWGRE